MNIKIDKNNKKFPKARHRGVGLIMALIVALIGTAVSAIIFEMSASFLNTSQLQKKTYEDGISAQSEIERAKGEIIFANKAQGYVLHGTRNTSANFEDETDKITSVAGLSIDVGERLNQPIENRIVDTKIFDASYKAARINTTLFPAADYHDLPPSFFIENNATGGLLNTTTTSMEPHGAGGTGGGSAGGLEELYKRYGVYMVQVKVFERNLTGNPKGKLIRKTEEVFVHLLPTPTPTPTPTP